MAVLIVTVGDVRLVWARGSPRSECHASVEVKGRREWRTPGAAPDYAPVTVGKRDTELIQESCGDTCEFNLRLCANLPQAGCTPASLSGMFVYGYTDHKLLLLPALDGTASCVSHFEPIAVRLGKANRVTRHLTSVAMARKPRDRDRDVVALVCKRSPRLCCGDQKVTDGEQCDDGNSVGGDGCDPNCTPTACGNGFKDDHEECDDGNQVSGDGCDVNCTASSCGNGIISKDAAGNAEECDPPATDECRSGSVCVGCQCTCPASCECPGLDPRSHFHLLTFKTLDGGGACGTVTDGAGAELKRLDCGNLYLGGGSAPSLPESTPVDSRGTLTTAATCDGARLQLSGAGDSAGCTNAGCLFGMPIPVESVPPRCIVASLARSIGGEVDCTTWATKLNVPLQVDVFSACPVCPPTAARLEQCATNGLTHFGTFPISDLALTTEKDSLSSKSASDGQFCGFCHHRPDDCYQGDPECDRTESGGHGPVPCDAHTPCASRDFPVCEQRTAGAFKKPGAQKVSETGGVRPANLGEGQPAAATLVGVFCVPPTFASPSLIDVPAGLPGPAAIGLSGELQVIDDPSPHSSCQ